MKTCKKCNTDKPLEDFYKMHKSRDGRMNECRECAKARSRRNRLASIDYYRAYDRARGNRQSEAYLSEYREKYPRKYKAHNKVNNAIRDKKLFREPCESCGAENSVAHHDDYSKPLDVRWLCQACHKQWHAKYGEGKNAA